MKHTGAVTSLLLAFFLVTQLIGLGLVALATPTDYVPPSTGEAAQRGGSLVVGVLLGTLLLLGIIRFGMRRLWKVWFFLAVLFAMGFAFDVLLPEWLALALATGLAAWKIFRPNVLIHNLTEVFIYSGIAVLVATGFNLNVIVAAGLLVLISLYDMWAVWRSKHMIRMAEFQTQSNLFAGMLIPYDRESGDIDLAAQAPRKTAKTAAPEKAKKAPAGPDTGGTTAVLGGGDIAFPLIFSATVLQSLLQHEATRWSAFLLSIFPSLGAMAGLLLLFTLAKKDRFYPAMPFASVGTFVGAGAMYLVLAIL